MEEAMDTIKSNKPKTAEEVEELRLNVINKILALTPIQFRRLTSLIATDPKLKITSMPKKAV